MPHDVTIDEEVEKEQGRVGEEAPEAEVGHPCYCCTLLLLFADYYVFFGITLGIWLAYSPALHVVYNNDCNLRSTDSSKCGVAVGKARWKHIRLWLIMSYVRTYRTSFHPSPLLALYGTLRIAYFVAVRRQSGSSDVAAHEEQPP